MHCVSCIQMCVSENRRSFVQTIRLHAVFLRMASVSYIYIYI